MRVHVHENIESSSVRLVDWLFDKQVEELISGSSASRTLMMFLWMLLGMLPPPSVSLACRDALPCEFPSCQCVRFHLPLSCCNWMKGCVVFNSAAGARLVPSNEAQQSWDAHQEQPGGKHDAEDAQTELLATVLINQPEPNQWLLPLQYDMY